MAVRPAWKGYLKLSLVTCAVEIFNATTYTEKVSFHIVNRKTGHLVKRKYVDSQTGRPVDEGDQAKGFERSGGDYVFVEEDEIEKVQVESSHTMNIEGFVEKAEIDPIYLDTPYYLAPADDVSGEAFAVIRDSLKRKKMAAMARLVLYKRERPVVIEPRDRGMLLTTLRFDKLVRKPSQVFKEIPKVEADDEMTTLASHIIDTKVMKFDPSKFEDKYENALLALIKAKKAGRKPPEPKEIAKPSNVVDLFDALKRSLGEKGSDSGAAKPKRGESKARGKAAAHRSRSAAHARQRRSA